LRRRQSSRNWGKWERVGGKHLLECKEGTGWGRRDSGEAATGGRGRSAMTSCGDQGGGEGICARERGLSKREVVGGMRGGEEGTDYAGADAVALNCTSDDLGKEKSDKGGCRTGIQNADLRTEGLKLPTKIFN